MTLTVAPAAIDEAVALYVDLMPAKPITFNCAMLQLARARNDAFHDAAGTLIAVASYYPLPSELAGERLFELAFVCRPALRRHLLAFVHLAHLTRGRLAQDGPVRVRAHVRSGHLPGRRLAALCGLRLIGPVDAFDRYEFEVANERIRQEHPVAVQRA